jgi:addiction module RelE/StbE family toxin
VTEIRWTEQAADDLAGIRDFISRDSPAHALATVERLYLAVDQLRAFPDSGRVVPEREEPGLRELIRSPYRIVYRRHAEVIEVLTVFHATRSFPDLLR